jgi:hypothetical protein
VVGILAFGLSLSSNAIPVLKLVLTGDASRMGAGAESPFFDHQLDALHLEQPALLTELSAPTLRFEYVGEKTLDLGGAQFFSGTRVENSQALVTYAHPFRIGGRPVTLLASGELTTGLLRIQDETDGLVTQLNEHRARGALGFGAEPWKHLRIGASAFLGGLPSYTLEAIGDFGPFEFGGQLRNEDLGYSLTIPSGSLARAHRPELDYPMHEVRETRTLTARVRTSWTDSAAWIDLVHGDPVLDSALLLGPWLTVRGRYEQTHLTFDDWASNKGVPVAHIDLDIVVKRWALGTEFKWGRSELLVRFGETDLLTTSHWIDNGVVTGQQFFSLPIDLGLTAEQLFRAHVSQWSFGWNGNFAPVIVSLGLQHLRLHNDAGGYSYGSSVDVSFGSRHVITPADLEAVAFTGGVSIVFGKASIHLAAAQLVPITGPPGGMLAKRTGPTPPPSGNTTAPAPPAPPPPTSDGGRVFTVDVNRTF